MSDLSSTNLPGQCIEPETSKPIPGAGVDRGERSVAVHQAMFQPCPKCGRTKNPRTKTCGACATKGHRVPSKVVPLICLNCKKTFEIPEWRFKQGRGMFCSRSCKNTYLTTVSGTSHPKSTGRFAPARYDCERWEKAKADVLERAGGKCESCKIELSEVKRYAVHHIKGVHLFENPEDGHTSENLLVICQSCHAKIHRLGRNVDNRR